MRNSKLISNSLAITAMLLMVAACGQAPGTNTNTGSGTAATATTSSAVVSAVITTQ